MSWLRKSTTEPLTVAMTGVKLADRVLIVGCSDPALIARLAIKAGLTGRACAVDRDAALVERTARTVEREGALVETSAAELPTLPFGQGTFDIVVLRDILGGLPEGSRAALVAEAQRVLRPGGRCLAIDTASRAGLGGLLSRPASTAFVAGGGAEPLLAAAGFAAVRTLAEREGVSFVEGVKRNT
jgi:SAM-dependent methyltransferase